MNNYRVSVDLTITANHIGDLLDVVADFTHKIHKTLESYDGVDIRVGKVSTDLLNRPNPLWSMSTPITSDVTVKAVRPLADNDDDEFLEPEYGDYLDEDDQ